MKSHYFNDPVCMPGTSEGPEAIYQRTQPLVETPGQIYVERRGIPLDVATAAGLRFAPDFNGRPAVVAALQNRWGAMASIHGRYLHTIRGQNKMFTIGPGDGLVNVLGGWHTEPLIIVEGLFDALSLAASGWPAVAPIGRNVSWLPEAVRGRTVWIAFDSCKPAEVDFQRYKKILSPCNIIRLLPPLRCKDWNTALVKHGPRIISHWIQSRMSDRVTI